MAEYIPWDKACSFTCPLTCDGPGDPDHESQADRAARLARRARTHAEDFEYLGLLHDTQDHADRCTCRACQKVRDMEEGVR